MFRFKPQHLKKEWSRDGCLKPIQSENAFIEAFVCSLSNKERPIEQGICVHVLQQCFMIILALLPKRLERFIDLVLGCNHSCLHAEIIPNKRANIVTSAFLYLVPILLIEQILLSRGQPHQDKIANLVSFSERNTCRV